MQFEVKSAISMKQGLKNKLFSLLKFENRTNGSTFINILMFMFSLGMFQWDCLDLSENLEANCPETGVQISFSE